MGAGKTCIGRHLAARFALPFVDADAEIEAAAQMSIPDIFEAHGEAAFRDGERRVIARLLRGEPHVLATGGGAFMNERTRAVIKQRAISVWLRANLDLLVRRTAKRNHRPLLRHGNPRDTLRRLQQERDPFYAEADIVVDSRDAPPEVTVDALEAALKDFVARNDPGPPLDGAPCDDAATTDGEARPGDEAGGEGLYPAHTSRKATS